MLLNFFRPYGSFDKWLQMTHKFLFFSDLRTAKPIGCREFTFSLEGGDHFELDLFRWVKYLGVKVGQLGCTLSLLSHMGSNLHIEVRRKSMGFGCLKRVMYIKCLIYTPGNILFTKQELTCCDMSFPFHLAKASPKSIQSLLLRTCSCRNSVS